MKISGLNVNSSKSSIWFSPNTPEHLKNLASSILGFKTSDKPSLYLGIPLGISGKTKDFDCVIDKIKSRINSWSNKYLSHAGKIVLIKPVCSAILAFYMQSLPFPKSLYLVIDKQIRDFFWSSFHGKQKLHLVNWNSITLPTEEGGLGLFKTFERNQAFLGKLVWRMMHESSSPWAMICNHRLKSKSKASILLKSLKRGLLILNKGVKHIIHYGSQTSLWFDNWLPMGPLRNLISGPLLLHDENLTVADALTLEGFWDWQHISFTLPQKIYHAFISSPRDPLSSTHDVISWGHSSNGIFSVKAAYLLHLHSKNYPSRNLKWIWSLNCHPRIKFFTWLICHDSVATILNLAKKGMSLYPYCVMCGTHDESVDHLFQSCPISLMIFSMCSFPSNTDCADFFTWFKACATSKDPSYLHIPFGTIFLYYVWNIWLSRNRKIFHNEPIFPSAIYHSSITCAAEFFHLTSTSSAFTQHSQHRQSSFISWNPPQEGWFKINVDGACDPTSNNIVAGGLIRDHRGN